MLRFLGLAFALLIAALSVISQPPSRVWVADNGDGTYRNPIIHADYSDPDVRKGAICSFAFSADGSTFKTIGKDFKAREGRWIGAKVGFVFTRPGRFNDAGTADIDWIRFER